MAIVHPVLRPPYPVTASARRFVELLLWAIVVAVFVAPASAAAENCSHLTGAFSAEHSGITGGAGVQFGSCGGSEAPEAEIVFTAPRAGAYTFDTVNSSFDTVLYVRNEAGAELACNDDIEEGINSRSRLTVTLAAGQTVRVFVDGFGAQQGAFQLRVNADCPLPFRADPRDLSGALFVAVTGNTLCGLGESNRASCGDGGMNSPGVSFVYTAPVSGLYEFSTEGSGFDTILSVRLGTCSGEELACNDNVAPGIPASYVRTGLSVGQTVIVSVDGAGGASGNFILSIKGVPHTPTVSPTRTASRSATATPTRTQTATITLTPSRTATRTPTRSGTATPTRTPTRTPTATRSATSTATPTWTGTPTKTPTRTGTSTATLSPTVTSTPTISRTPSATPTPSTTRTPTHTATRTKTATATITATATFNGLGCCQRLIPAPQCDAPVTLVVCEALAGIFVPGATCNSVSCVGGSPVPTATLSPTPTGTTTIPPSLTPSRTPPMTPTPAVSGCCQLSAGQCAAPVMFASCALGGGTFFENATCVGGGCVAAVPSTTATATRTETDTPSPSSTPSPIPSSTPQASRTATATPRPTLTPFPTWTATVAVQQAQIEAIPAHVLAGAAVQVSGQVMRGNNGVRVFWQRESLLEPLTEIATDATGAFRTIVLVPAGTPPGAAAFCVTATQPGLEGRDLACADLMVQEMPPAFLSGSMFDRNGTAVANGDIRLMATNGQPVALATTDQQGQYAITVQRPGVFELQARCAPSGSCDGETNLFATRSVVVAPGAALRVDLPGSAPPGTVAINGVGGVALPGGILEAEQAIPVIDQRAEVAGEFASLAGAGLPPLVVRFWADVQFWSFAPHAVRFTITDGAEMIAVRSVATPQPIIAGDPVYGFNAYVADFNVNDLPPGDLRLLVTPVVGGTDGPARRLTLRFADLSRRWGAPPVRGGAVRVTATRLGVLGYEFLGWLPQPAFDFSDQFTLSHSSVPESLEAPFGLVLDTSIAETYWTDRTWHGRASTLMAANLLDADSGTAESQSGIVGDDIGSALYPQISMTTEPGDCLVLPPLAYTDASALSPCDTCNTAEANPMVQAEICQRVRAWSGVEINEGLQFSAQAALEVEAAPPLELEVDNGLCAGRAVMRADAYVMLELQSSPLGVQYVASPCLIFGGAATYQPLCLNIPGAVDRQSLPMWSNGCPSPLRLRPPEEPPGVAPRPAVAMNPAGKALALWVQDGPVTGPLPDRRIVFSQGSAAGWTVPLPLTAAAAAVDQPQVGFLDSERALAVWVESRLPLAEALVSGGSELLASSELRFALWDGVQWGPAQSVTSGDTNGVAPALAVDPKEHTAMLVWLRARRVPGPDGGGAGVAAARFDGLRWGEVSLLGEDLRGVSRMPAAGIDRQGNARAIWVQELDGNPATVDDRQVMWAAFESGGWTSPLPVPGLPSGAFAPALAFDEQSRPAVAFVAPAGGKGSISSAGNGNTSELHVASFVNDNWTVERIGTGIRAEKPRIGIWKGVPAVLFRRFDTVPPHWTGDLGVVLRNGSGDRPWNSFYLSSDGAVHSAVAFAADAGGAAVAVLDVVRPEADSVATVERRWWPALADLVIGAEDVRISNLHPDSGETVSVSVTLRNTGWGDVVTPFNLRLYDGGVPVAVQEIPNLPAGGVSEAVLNFVPVLGGERELRVVADTEQRIEEVTKENNSSSVRFPVVPVPVGLSNSVDVVAETITLQWRATPGLGYRVFRRASGGIAELLGATDLGNFADNRVQQGIEFEYFVVAADATGLLSEPSATVRAILRAPRPCIGDCNGDGEVTVDELLIGVNIALENQPISRCPAFDANVDEAITIDELLVGVNHALNGCLAP